MTFKVDTEKQESIRRVEGMWWIYKETSGAQFALSVNGVLFLRFVVCFVEFSLSTHIGCYIVT